MRYYIIAGEASGDLHASNLMKHLKQIDAHAEFRCWGGNLMQQQGGLIVKHYRDLAFMGFVEVVANLRTILKNIEFCKKDILTYKPDVLILVDYPGFNLRIAQFAKAKGFKVFYYISPQIWAWKESRVHQIKRNVDAMFTILPFEKEFYKKHNYQVYFVGHPLLDAISNRKEKLNHSDFCKKYKLPEKPIIALLPGSRKQEIKKMLPVMAECTKNFKDYQFVIAGAPSIPIEFYKEVLDGKEIPIIQGATYELLEQSKAALVTSGTATLETALFNIPEVVCYTGGTISYYIARSLIKVKYISLVNLIMDKELVKELIQHDFNVKTLNKELNKLLNDRTYRENMLQGFKELREKLGGEGASLRAAEKMYALLKS
ncbi:MAG: lipid-A-disaccharide synthase [Bacteroidia bacterium]